MLLPDIVAKLQDNHDVLNKNKMPPRKFLKHHPDKALNAKDKNLLANWAISSAESLIEKQITSKI